MGSNDIPPPHVPPTYHLITTILLGTGGALYTATYLLMTLQSQRDRTYAMPLLSLSMNVGWELIFSIYVAEALPERLTFLLWLLLDTGLVHAALRHGPHEWRHAPAVGAHLGAILGVGIAWWCAAFYALCAWWLDPVRPVNPKSGKHYMGVAGTDTTELGFWSALAAQVVLSVSLLAQIVVRGHSGGASYGIWAMRFWGSVSGLLAYYAYCWVVWPEAHAYFVNPLAVCWSATWVVADLVYLGVLVRVRRTERVLSDGRKVRGEQEKGKGLKGQ